MRLDGDPNNILLWDEFGHQIAFLEDTKTVVRRKVTSWIRRAILRTLVDRCAADRKDMCGITCYIDRDATLANFTAKAAEMPYATNNRMRHVLRSIIAGSIRARDRLMKANIINDDKCTCAACNGTRHTTIHLFWHCEVYASIRKPFTDKIVRICELAKRLPWR